MGFDFLFAQPSWLSGAARVLDLTGEFDEYNNSPDGETADAKAQFIDWSIVGENIVNAMKAFGSEKAVPPPEVK